VRRGPPGRVRHQPLLALPRRQDPGGVRNRARPVRPRDRGRGTAGHGHRPPPGPAAGRPLHATCNPDGRELATAEYDRKAGSVRVWDLAGGTGRLLATLPSYVNDLAFSPDGKRLFAAVDNHSLRCWDLASGKALWQNDHWASHLAVAPDGKTLATDTYQGAVPLPLWDAATGRPAGSLAGASLSKLHLAFAPDGRTLAQGTRDDVVLWDLASRKPRHRFTGAGPAVAFAPDGRSLCTLGPLLGRWDVRTGRPLYPDVKDRGHVGPVVAVTFAPDGRSLASRGDDGSVRLWDRATAGHRVLQTGCDPRPRAIRGGGELFLGSSVLAFTPDGVGVLTDAAPGTLRLAEVATGKELQRFTLPPPGKGLGPTVSAARLTPDGRSLLGLGRTGGLLPLDLSLRAPVAVWDVATGKPVRNDFSDDGRLLAAAEPGLFSGPVRAVRVYEVLTGRLLMRVDAALGNSPRLAFSPDGRMLTAPGTDALYVWDSVTSC
jgi:WD40 repeat protein